MWHFSVSLLQAPALAAHNPFRQYPSLFTSLRRGPPRPSPVFIDLPKAEAQVPLSPFRGDRRPQTLAKSPRSMEKAGACCSCHLHMHIIVRRLLIKYLARTSCPPACECLAPRGRQAHGESEFSRHFGRLDSIRLDSGTRKASYLCILSYLNTTKWCQASLLQSVSSGRKSESTDMRFSCTSLVLLFLARCFLTCTTADLGDIRSEA